MSAHRNQAGPQQRVLVAADQSLPPLGWVWRKRGAEFSGPMAVQRAGFGTPKLLPQLKGIKQKTKRLKKKKNKIENNNKKLFCKFIHFLQKSSPAYPTLLALPGCRHLTL